MKAKTNSSRLRWMVVAAVCVLVTPALLLTSCDNLFGSDSSADPSVPEMPIAALVGVMGTMHEAIEAAEDAMDGALDDAGALNALDDFVFIPPSIFVKPLGDGVYRVTFTAFKPFDDDVIFRTVNLSKDTALTGEVTVAFTDAGTTSTITLNGSVNAENYPADQLTFSNVVLTFSDDGENGSDFPDTVSGTATVDGTTWPMDHVFQVFLSGVYTSYILNLNALDDPSDGGLIALFVSSYNGYLDLDPEEDPPEGVEVLEYEAGATENMLHLRFTDFDPTGDDGGDEDPSTIVNGTQRGIVNTTESPWLRELRADLSVEMVDDEGEEYTIVLRDGVLRLPQDWETPGVWGDITWDGQLGVNGVFFRLDYLLDVMHVMGAMGMLD